MNMITRDSPLEAAANEAWRDHQEARLRESVESMEKVMRFACETGKPISAGVFTTQDGKYAIEVIARKLGERA